MNERMNECTYNPKLLRTQIPPLLWSAPSPRPNSPSLPHLHRHSLHPFTAPPLPIPVDLPLPHPPITPPSPSSFTSVISLSPTMTTTATTNFCSQFAITSKNLNAASTYNSNNCSRIIAR